MEQKDKIKAFAELVEIHCIEGLKKHDLGCDANVEGSRTHIKPGKKYTKVDVGTSGRYMVENDTGRIYGIKAYGVIHRGHFFGTLDDFQDKNWAFWK